MANLKSSKKYIKVNAKKRKRNLFFKNRMKTFVKKSVIAIEKKAENVTDSLKEALKIIDKTAAKGVIKKKTASRKKSRLMKLFNKKQKKA